MENQNGMDKTRHVIISQLIRNVFLAFCIMLVGVVISACTSTSAEESKPGDNAFVTMDADIQEENSEPSDRFDLLEDNEDGTDSNDEPLEDEDETNNGIVSDDIEESTDESVPENIPIESDHAVTGIKTETETDTDIDTDTSSQAPSQVDKDTTNTDDSDNTFAVAYTQTNNATDTTETTNTAETTNTTENTDVPQTETYVSGGFPLWNYSWHSRAYIGRMRIPSVGVNVGLYNTCEQYAIDAWDSAAIAYHWELDHDQTCYSTIYCCDHNYQGFNVIANCSVGDAMYIDGVDGNTYKYICDRIDYNGYNTGYGLNDSSGNTVNYTGGLWVYTCCENGPNSVYMVHFHAV